MVNPVYSSVSKGAIVQPTLEGFEEWLRSKKFPQDFVGWPSYNRAGPLARYIEHLNPGTLITVTPKCYYVNHEQQQWSGDFGGCIVEHIFELTEDRYISALDTLKAIEEAKKIFSREAFEYL